MEKEEKVRAALAKMKLEKEGKEIQLMHKCNEK